MIASGGVAATSSGIGSCQSANALSSADFSAGGSSPPLSRLRTLAHQYTWLPESLATPKSARAAASPGQDDEVADELEQAARRAQRRSGFAAAARALERAAEPSSDDDPRGRRLVAAADEAWLAGAPDQALALLDRAGGLVSDVRVRADLMHLRGTIGLRCGVPAEAATILAAGAAEVAPVVPAKAIEMLVEAAEAASYAGDAAQIVEFGRRASALLEDDAPDERFTVDVIVGIGSLLAGGRGGWSPAAQGSARARRGLSGSSPPGARWRVRWLRRAGVGSSLLLLDSVRLSRVPQLTCLRRCEQ